MTNRDEEYVQTPIFRPAVVAEQGLQVLGSIRLLQPISSTLTTVIAIFLIAVIVLFIVFGSYGKKVRVTGLAVPINGSIIISAPAAGAITNMTVAEGAYVRKGDHLFDIVTPRHAEKGEVGLLVAQQLNMRRSTLETERRARTAQDIEKRSLITAKLENFKTELSQLESEINSLNARYSFANDTVKKFETLQGEGFVSSIQTQQKKEELIDVISRISNTKRAKTQIEAAQIANKADRNNIQLATLIDISQIDRAIAAVDQEAAENSTRGSTLVLAPESGTVTAITYRNGESVGSGQVVVSIVMEEKNRGDSPEIEVELFAPSRATGFLEAGQKVMIRYNSFPYQKFGLYEGIVREISKSAIAPSELPQHYASTIVTNAQQTISGFNGNEGLFRVRVKLKEQYVSLYGRKRPIVAGTTLEADIVHEKRFIWEWIFEPLIAMSK